MNESTSIIDKLHHVLDEGDGLADRLERSLVEAHARAQSELNPAVFDALDWPTDLAAYERYLQGFLRLIPQQSDTQAWKQPAPKERFAKEVSVRLGHFFFLIDQKVDDDSVIVENSEAFGAAPDRRPDQQPRPDLGGGLQLRAPIRHRRELPDPRDRGQDDTPLRQHHRIARRKPVRRALRCRHVRALHAAALGLSPIPLSGRGPGQGVVRDRRAGLHASRH